MKGLAKQRAFQVQNIMILGEWELLDFTAGRLLTVLILPGEKTKKSAQFLNLTSELISGRQWLGSIAFIEPWPPWEPIITVPG